MPISSTLRKLRIAEVPMNKPVQPPNQPKFLLDPYLAWAENEGVPISEDFGIDLLKVPVAHWPRMGTDGGIVHLKGRGDFIAMYVLDLPEGGKSDAQKHIYEEVVYVLSGHG